MVVFNDCIVCIVIVVIVFICRIDFGLDNFIGYMIINEFIVGVVLVIFDFDKVVVVVDFDFVKFLVFVLCNQGGDKGVLCRCCGCDGCNSD